MKWVYDKAASTFGEADPIGNGHMGGMVYGGVTTDRIDLSELTFFSGERSTEENYQEHASSAFYQMRDSTKKENYEEAKNIAAEFIGIRNNYGTNLPVGTLLVHLQDAITEDEVLHYQRSLDYGTGIASSSFDYGTETMQRECYVSWPDKIMIYHIHCTNPSSFDLEYQNSNAFGTITYEEDGIQFLAKAYEKIHSDGTSGVHLYGRIRVKTDGDFDNKEQGLQIKNATQVICYISMNTNYADQDEERDWIKEAMGQPIANIKKRHQMDVYHYMSRVSLDIQGKEVETGLVSGMFQYGRYLLLSSSREDSLLPAHLQGIWNDYVACRIGWTCDMHLDINTQMNYWPAEVTNLSELSTPLFRWVEETLIPQGRVGAKKSYGLKGWIGEIVSNPWGFAAPYWGSPIAPCPTGGIWILSHLWEHGFYTENLAFLKDHAYAAMYEAATFFKDYLFEVEGGQYSCGPSISPENSFRVGEKVYQISNGCTYEILMIRELFEQLCEVEKRLGIVSELGREVGELAKKLLPYRIEHDGTIAEWSHHYEAADPQHRHTSHLLGVYPYAQITVENTPKLAQAVIKTLEKKSIPPENWEDTGWARSMLLLYRARLQEGDVAFAHIQSMFKNLLESNHFIIHPPTRGAGSFANVYELDGNTGLTTGIAEMLLQSYHGVIRLLPALPKDWESGKITGLKARGDRTVSIEWEHGTLKESCIIGKKGTLYKVRYKNVQVEGLFEETGVLILNNAHFISE